MGLKIFGDEGAPTASDRTSDDVVGRFRAGYVAGKRPVSLSKFFVTTGDEDVAQAMVSSLGVDQEADGDEDIVEYGEDDNRFGVFTDADSIEVVIPSAKCLRQRMVLWVNGKLIHASDGEVITYPDEKIGQPSPQAGLTMRERKQEARDGLGEKPEISLLFRLTGEDGDLGLFRFQSGSWDLASDIAYHETEDALAEIDGPALATLSLEVVTFTAKSGPRKGKEVSYTKPVIKILGPAED